MEVTKTRRRSGKVKNYVIIYGILTVALAFVVIPILWGLSTSLKPVTEVNSIPPSWLPNDLTLENYDIVLFKSKFFLFFKNTVVVIAFSLLLTLFVASHAAWAVARKKFFGKDTLLLIMWSTIMIPGVSIIVPLYLISVSLNIHDTYLVLVLVFSAWGVPTLIWLLRGFISGIPVELEEAAKVDGCSSLGAFYRITVPLLPPGLIAGSMMVFVLIWNDFVIPYSLVISDERRIIQVGLYSFITEAGIEWGPLMAALFGSLVPVLLLYTFLQRYFIQGLTGGALKG